MLVSIQLALRNVTIATEKISYPFKNVMAAVVFENVKNIFVEQSFFEGLEGIKSGAILI
jgi:hypothetical protein